MANTPTKKWYSSKTIWVAIITIALGILTAVEANLTLGVVAIAKGVLDFLLRYTTTTTIE